MNTERRSNLKSRASIHAALGDPARLRIVDTLLVGDASPSELADSLGMPSNLVAHHLKVLETAGVLSRRRSEGDGRRTYLRLSHGCLSGLAAPVGVAPDRVVFVCTANSARSHLAAALWRRASPIPTASAGTHPADRIDPGAIEVAERHRLPLPRPRPRRLDELTIEGDVVVTVCDLAHEELGAATWLHWSIPDPKRIGIPAAYDAAYDELATRVTDLAQRFPHAS